MAQNDQIQLFENKRIRTAWDAEKEEWFFSIVDVVAVLTDQPDARHASTYWAVLKKRLNDEGAGQLLTNCKQLKMLTPSCCCASFSLFHRQKPNRSNSGWRRSAGNASRKPSIQS